MPRTKTSASSTTTTKSLAAARKKSRHEEPGPTEPEPPTAAQLLSQSHQTMDEWYKSVRTKKGYANYLKSGKEWLVEWAKKPELAGRTEDNLEVDDDLEINLATAFDSIIEQTPVALRMLISYKRDHQGRGFATAEGIRSAFKHYFER
jgi:hypothetical protein